MNPHITIIIAPDGTPKVEAHNYTGIECSIQTAPYRQALGTQTDNTIKPDIYTDNPITNTQDINQ